MRIFYRQKDLLQRDLRVVYDYNKKMPVNDICLKHHISRAGLYLILKRMKKTSTKEATETLKA